MSKILKIVKLVAATAPLAVTSAHAEPSRSLLVTASQATMDAIRAELAAQRALITEQGRIITAQQAQIQALQQQRSGNPQLAEIRGAGAPPTTPPGDPAPQQTVGEAPPLDRDLSPQVASIPDGQGVLTPRGTTVIEPSIEYTRSSNNRLVFRGIELIPGLQLGLIEASDVDRDTVIGTISVRHGLTNRLEVEARIPALARRDRIQVVQQRDQNIVREIALSGFDLGDAELALRYQLNRAKGPESPIYVANLRVKSNTGLGPFDVGYDAFGVAEGLATGSGFWGVQGGVNFLLPTDPAVIYGGVGYLWHIPRRIDKTVGEAFVGRVDPGDAISGNLGFGFALNPRFSVSLGYNLSLIMPSKTEIGGTIQRSKALQVGTLGIGSSYRITEKQSVSLGFEFGMTSDAPDASIVLRLPFRF